MPSKKFRPRLSKAEWELVKAHRSKSNTLVIGDTHLPWEHENYLPFCIETAERMGCSEIVHIGDLVDNHAISYHESNPDLPSAGYEYENALKKIEKWVKEFPKVKMCIGNHDLLPKRKIKTIGLPSNVMKSFNEFWNLPDSWEVADEWILDGVIYTHGVGSSGINGAINRAIKNRRSTVIGHSHQYGSVQYSTNAENFIFGMYTGCGIDYKKLAFEYGKAFANKPTLGCGVITNGGEIGFFIPMTNE